MGHSLPHYFPSMPERNITQGRTELLFQCCFLHADLLTSRVLINPCNVDQSLDFTLYPYLGNFTIWQDKLLKSIYIIYSLFIHFCLVMEETRLIIFLNCFHSV